MPEKVVVTGVGVVSPLGSMPHFWRRLCAGESGIAPIAAAEATPDGPALEARARDWNARDHVRPALLRRMDRCSQMIVTACRLALADAGLTLAENTADAASNTAKGGGAPAAATDARATVVDGHNAAVVIGTAFGNLSESEDFVRGLFAKGPGLVNPLTFPNLVLNAPAGYVAIALGVHGPNLSVVRGEASGEAALATAYDTIASGHAELVLAGGGDELAPVLRRIYADLGLLSPTDGGGEWSSPFDRRRNGFVMGEGAGVLVLETERHATARGARILAELVGWANESLAASPHDWPTVATAERADDTRGALAALGFDPERADAAAALVVSCAASSERLDRVEAARIAALLGTGASRALVTSIKGAVGEFGAAGALGAIAAVLALATGDVPRLGNLGMPDPDCTLPLAGPHAAAPSDGFAQALLSATPRGGGAITVLFRRWP